MYLERHPHSATGIVGLAAHFSPGQSIYRQGDRGAEIFEVLAGLVMTGRCIGKGRRIDAFHGRGDAFGFNICDNRSQFAEAVSECSIASYRGKPSARSFPGPLLIQTLRSIARTRGHALVLRRRSAVARVAAFLVDGLERSDVASFVELPMTRRDVASYLRLAVRTVSATLLCLERDAVIDMPTRRRVRVLNLPELKRLGA